MQEQNLLPPRAKFLCSSCYETFVEDQRSDYEKELSAAFDKIESLLQQQMTTTSIDIARRRMKSIADRYYLSYCNNMQNELLSRLVEVLKNERNDLLSNENAALWQDLAYLIGERFCRKEVYADGRTLMNKYKDNSFYVNLDMNKYIMERNSTLVNFLSGLSGKVLSIVNCNSRECDSH